MFAFYPRKKLSSCENEMVLYVSNGSEMVKRTVKNFHKKCIYLTLFSVNTFNSFSVG